MNNALEKGIIKESVSLAKAPILFVFKKDKTFWLCINY